jgi:hypothetical protein
MVRWLIIEEHGGIFQGSLPTKPLNQSKAQRSADERESLVSHREGDVHTKYISQDSVAKL